MTASSFRRRARAFRTISTLAMASVLTVVGMIAAAKLAEPRSRPLAARVAHHAPRPSPSPTPSAPPSPWLLVSVGDSVPAGSACACTPYPNVYARRVGRRAGVTVDVRNNAVPGQTSGQLLDALRSSTPLRRDVARAQIITVTIGANDFDFSTFRPGKCRALSCYQPALDQLRRNLDATFDLMNRLVAGRPAAIRVTGYWEIWRDGEVGRRAGPTYMRVGDALTRRVNAVIADRAAAHGFGYVDLYAAFHGPGGDRDDTPLLASDGDHPSSSGHKLIVAALMASGLAPLLG